MQTTDASIIEATAATGSYEVIQNKQNKAKSSCSLTHREAVEEVDEHGSSERTLPACHEGNKGLPEKTRHSLHIQVSHCIALRQIMFMSKRFSLDTFRRCSTYSIRFICTQSGQVSSMQFQIFSTDLTVK